MYMPHVEMTSLHSPIIVALTMDPCLENILTCFDDFTALSYFAKVHIPMANLYECVGVEQNCTMFLGARTYVKMRSAL